MAHILVVDDLKNVRKTLSQQLRESGHQVVEADGGRSALGLLDKSVFDLVITDLRMDEVDGLSLLKTVKKNSPGTEVIVLTAYGTVESGVAAMKAGAHDYLTKPVQPAEMAIAVEQALAKRRLGDRLDRLQASGMAFHRGGKSRAWREMLEQVRKVAPTDATVLLTGESGAGKEVVAELIHSSSLRKAAPLSKINLGAIAVTLQESELFGHVKGSFTGAIAARKGIFMEADGATLFMDEIGEAAQSTQVSLLRVLAQGELRPVGGDRDVHIDVRVIAASNADLAAAVETAGFRQDLYFRINVFPIHVPALRERREDIPDLARHLLQRQAMKLNRGPVELAPDAIEKLEEYQWPGNVRELENILERTLILVSGCTLRAADLPLSAPVPVSGRAVSGAALRAARLISLHEMEREHVESMMRLFEGQRQKAADALGISRATLFRKLKEYGTT